jgi:hypothetical protein
MSSVEYQSNQEKSAPLLYWFWHWFFAVCIVGGTFVTLISVIANPEYYRVGNGEITAFIAAFATANPFMSQTHVVTQVLVGYLLPLGLLAMAWLAQRHSPWWSSIATLVVLIGLLPLAAFGGEDALAYDIARMGSNPSIVTMAFQFDHDGVMSYYKAMFILGSIVGPTLVGIALWRARAIPIWAAILITISRPIAFFFPFLPLQLGIIVQLPSCLLLFIGSIPAAVAMLKRRDGQERMLVPTAEGLTSTT